MQATNVKRQTELNTESLLCVIGRLCRRMRIIVFENIVQINQYKLDNNIRKQNYLNTGKQMLAVLVKHFPSICAKEWRDADVVMCLGQGAHLHMAQLMPLPLTISCSSKSRLVFTFLVLPFQCWLTWVVPDEIQEGRKTVVYVCVRVCVRGAKELAVAAFYYNKLHHHLKY